MDLKELLSDVAEVDNEVEIRAMSGMDIVTGRPRSLLKNLSELDLGRHIEKIHASGEKQIMVLVK